MGDCVEPGCDLRIGTSGYDYPEWRGVFYPEALARRDFPAFYAERFAAVELNFSFYAQPRAESIAALIARMGPTPDFSIKGHRSLTHDIDPAGPAAAAREFRTGIAPLLRSGRLCAILLGFPYSFHYRPDERRYLGRLLRELADLPLVVEFRNAEWYSARVIEGLSARRVGFCSVDTPRLDGLPPLSDLVTSDLAYVRFHGRNEASWWGGDAAARYDYLYSPEELRSWIPRIRSMAAQAKRLRVFFNNHRRGNAAANAADLARLMAAEPGGGGAAWLQARSST
jgi:uncharacterized protein YecE (DUF72 family)